MTDEIDEEIECKNYICKTVEEFAKFCLSCGAQQDTRIITFDEGEECEVEVEMLDFTSTLGEKMIAICASPLSSKNVGSLAGFKLALLCSSIGDKPPDEEDWQEILVLARQIISA